jgi:hypothetical protein
MPCCSNSAQLAKDSAYANQHTHASAQRAQHNTNTPHNNAATATAAIITP